MRIGERSIGEGEAVYIIAELGVNHDGSSTRAMEMVEAAAGAGADAVKLQYFEADLLMSRAARLATYQQHAGEADPHEMLRRLQLPIDALARIAERAHAIGLHAIVTVFSVDLVEAASNVPWDAFKTASPDVVHRPLLEALLATDRPLIVSTGAATLDEVCRAHGWLRSGTASYMFLQCVSCYPTPPEHAALGGIEALRRALDMPIGYSDHTSEVQTGALAVACGAVMLEKHLTLDRAARGPDHAASLDPEGFATYVRLAKRVRVKTLDPADPQIGPIEKRVLPIELDVRSASRQSITTTQALPAGHTLTTDDVTFKRPGAGAAPWRLPEVIGRRLVRAVEADVPLEMEMLEP
ncbi:MAG: N-acetylneuraminate synthase family protein [Phycisphaeraceae bacterium]|nr:N-acetylneuraminate synthase family protein [Phycisphaeraceae bacterium]